MSDIPYPLFSISSIALVFLKYYLDSCAEDLLSLLASLKEMCLFEDRCVTLAKASSDGCEDQR